MGHVADPPSSLDAFRGLTKDLITELGNEFGQPSYIKEWVNRLIYYTVPGGKMNRGLTVLHSLQALKGRPLTEEETFQAHVLGWSVEWLQAFFLISDDIMDASVSRRGQPCYYLSSHPLSHPQDENRQTVGTIAINDSFIVESHIYMMLKKHFRHQPYYAELVDLFHETAYQTELGQLLDLTSLRPGRLDFSLYTTERYKLIVKYKTAFYSFYLPVALALLIHHKQYIPEVFQAAKDITLPMGEFFQVQDDYLDCYGKPEQIGKVGRDIEEAKCGWIITEALKICTKEQYLELESIYGKDDPKLVARVKEIYGQLGMKRIYEQYEQQSYQQLKAMIASQNQVPREVFDRLLAKIYKRQK